MTAADVEKALGSVEFREKVILHLAIFSGLRPCEILALRRRSIGQDKNGKTRTVAIPPRTAALLSEWLATAVDPEPEAWVFASENRETPLWRDNLLRRHIRTQLEAVGLGWVDFKVMRRTNASLGHGRVDTKAAADQRGHGIGVSLEVYTQADIKQRAAVARKLENSALGTKVVRMPKRKAS